jgi:hypothetical protein
MLTRRALLAMTSASAMSGGLVPGKAQPLKPARTNLLTFHPQYVNTFKSPAPNLTFSSLYNLESPPSWIRLVYRNDMRDGETIDGAAVAPTAMAGDGFTPFNAQGQPDDSLWKRVTFDSDGGDSQPHAVKPSASDTIDISGDASFGRNPPPVTYSDWIPITALNRTDGGKGALLLVRSFSRGQYRSQFVRYQKIGGDAVGRVYAGFASPGDGTKTPWSFSGETSEIPAAYAVQYQSAVPGASVLFVGDSILAPPYDFNIGMRACALASTTQLPVSFINQSWLGARTDQFLFVAERELEWSRPQILVLQLWSGNDKGITDQSTDAVFAQAMSLVSLAMKKGCAPVLVTTPPSPKFPELESYRQKSNARIRAAAGNGMMMLDLDKLWLSPDAPTQFRVGYTRDQIHGNDTACQLAAETLAPMIRELLA